MKFIERHFCAICVVATLAGIFAPHLASPLVPLLSPFLMAILYLTCLKLDLAKVAGHLGRPARLAWSAALILLVAPAIEYGLAVLFVPSFALGVLLLGAMPAGMASASLTDVTGGDTEFSLVLTTVTSLLCPLTVPLIISFASTAGVPPMEILERVGTLAIYILVPGTAAVLTRKMLPGWVARNAHNFTGGAIIALALLILAAMAACSKDVLAKPWESLGLLLFLSLAFTGVLHVVGFFALPKATLGERKALSVSAAYINNALAIVFARRFFPDDASVLLPAVILELPMMLSLPILKRIGGARPDAAKGPEESATIS